MSWIVVRATSSTSLVVVDGTEQCIARWNRNRSILNHTKSFSQVTINHCPNNHVILTTWYPLLKVMKTTTPKPHSNERTSFDIGFLLSTKNRFWFFFNSLQVFRFEVFWNYLWLDNKSYLGVFTQVEHWALSRQQYNSMVVVRVRRN